ncbi:nitrogen permease regulator 2 [Syncephalis plumigaleata]|nr:nitrogen permease regulator 2 [Syncephalis plumigaleata]
MYLPTFQFPRIAAIFYAEFHPIQGPSIVYDVPEGSLTGQDRLLDFEAVSDYVIPKSGVTDRVITLTVGNYKLVGFPSRVEHTRYARNAIIFNMVFVFARQADTRAYEPVARKMAITLRTLEVESSYLHDESKRERIAMLMGQAYEDLNTMKECLIPIDQSHTVNLKLFPVLSQPPLIKDYVVPILTAPTDRLELDSWDITARKILEYIDGVAPIRRIAEMADVDTDKVRRLVRHLIYYGSAVIVDIFQYSNSYTLLDGATDLVDDPQRQKECMLYITKPGYTSITFSHIFSLYCALKPGITIKEWMQEYQVELESIDIRRMIAFGVINRLLRRLHCYPYLPEERRCHVPAALQRYLDGMHHYDEIGVALGYSPHELREILMRDATFMEINR